MPSPIKTSLGCTDTISRQYHPHLDTLVAGPGGGWQAGGGHAGLVEGDGVAEPQDGEVVLVGEAVVARVVSGAAHLQCKHYNH